MCGITIMPHSKLLTKNFKMTKLARKPVGGTLPTGSGAFHFLGCKVPVVWYAYGKFTHYPAAIR